MLPSLEITVSDLHSCLFSAFSGDYWSRVLGWSGKSTRDFIMSLWSAVVEKSEEHCVQQFKRQHERKREMSTGSVSLATIDRV
jgi:hypothetical protein